MGMKKNHLTFDGEGPLVMRKWRIKDASRRNDVTSGRHRRRSSHSRIVLPRQGIDVKTRTSMAMDVRAGKPTEIDALNGEITRLAAMSGLQAPLNAALCRLVAQAPPDVAMPAPALRAALT